MSVREKLTAIADAIRSARGAASTEKYSIDEMPEKISEAVDSAFDGGWYDGHQQGINEGIDAGKKSQYDEFWDNYQLNGSRTNYESAFFGVGWNQDTFKPKHPIVVGTGANVAYNMFGLFDDTNKSVSQVLDYRTIKDKIDLSQAVQTRRTFYGAFMNYIEVDLSNSTSLVECFDGGWRGSRTTDLTLTVSEKCTSFASAFTYCNYLQNLFFTDGSVIAVNIAFAQSPNLTHESLMSIINALKDYSGTTSTYTLTLHADAKARLSDAEKAIITQKGWTLA